MRVLVNETSDSAEIKIEGPIEMGSIKTFKAEVIEAFKDRTIDIILDLDAVDYIDSTGIGNLIAIAKMQKQKERGLSIINVPSKVVALLEMSSLKQYMQV